MAGFFFSGSPKRRKTPAAVLRSLQGKLNKKKRKEDKKRNDAKIRTAIDSTRKKLRGY